MTVGKRSAARVLDSVATRAAMLSADAQETGVTLMQHAFDHNQFSGMKLLRKRWPIARIARPSVVVVTRRDDVLEVLHESSTFCAPYGDRLPGPFVLGLDGPEYERHRTALREVLAPGDLLDDIDGKVRRTAEVRVRAGVEQGHLDVGAELVHPVLDQVLDDFLGVPAPDPQTFSRWSRDVFENIFLNLPGLPAVREQASVAGKQMGAHVRSLVDARRGITEIPPRDVLGRLLALPGANDDTALSPDEIVSSLIGLAIGWLWHGARTALIAVDQLLSMPDALSEAHAAATAGDHDWLARVLWEVLRFRPVQPFLVRAAKRSAVIAAGTERETRVPKGALVLVGTHSAMWDDAAIPCPGRFDSTRADDQYLIFGRDMHRCLGEEITRVQLPAMLAPLLRVGGLRRGSRLRWAGPRPDDVRVVFPS